MNFAEADLQILLRIANGDKEKLKELNNYDITVKKL